MTTLRLMWQYRWKTGAMLYAFLRRMLCPFSKINRMLGYSYQIADIGCGRGALATYLALSNRNRYVVGFDPDKEKIAEAGLAGARQKRLHFVAGYFSAGPSGLDAAVLSDVLHHMTLEKQDELVRQVFDALRPGGMLLVKEICSDDLIRFRLSSFADSVLYPSAPCHFRRKYEWTECLKRQRLDVNHYRIAWSILSTHLFVARKVGGD